MNIASPRPPVRRRPLIALAAAAALAGVVGWSGCDSNIFSGTAADEHAEDAHAEDAHDHGDANEDLLDLSPQAQRNIGLKIGPSKLQSFDRAITIPGIIVERPGRTSVAVAAPLSGVVDRVMAVEGQAVSPSDPLFAVRLTHEEIVQAQSDFLKTAVELEVIGREVERLEKVTAEGAIAGRTLLERKYEQEKQQAILQAGREALVLHGLSEAQVNTILNDQRLLKGLTVFAPKERKSKSPAAAPLVWQVQQLLVKPGQHVEAGETLAVLADYRSLYIEGKAFEQDSREIAHTVERDWPVAAIIDASGAEPEVVDGLALAYTSSRVDTDSRTFRFYVKLANQRVRDVTNDEGTRFINWRFKLGQRVDLRVPVERWNERLVLPVDAVARDGAESYVFQVSGNAFLRRPVHVEYRDPLWTVIANDGSLFPGEVVALSGAQQMQIALKNQQGGALDPHAGHSH